MVHKSTRKLWIFDFDGTLSEIVSDPAAARINRKCMKMIEALASSPRHIVSVLSSRIQEDIESRICFPNVHIGGSSGIEWNIAGMGRFRRAAALQKIRDIRPVAMPVLKEIEKFQGILIEDKFWAATVHMRGATPQAIEETMRLLNKKPLSDLKQYSAPKAVEIHFISSGNKSFGVRYLFELLDYHASPGSIVYSGDDENDAAAMDSGPRPGRHSHHGR